TLDADVLLPIDWYLHLIEMLQREPADLWLFPVLINDPSTPLQRFEALDVLSLAGTTAAFAHQHHAIMGSGACLVVRTEVYREAVKHLRDDLVSGDDVFLVQHLRKEKRRIRFIDHPELQVRVEGHSSLRGFLRQRVR
ncbi:glycosyltransferase family 2 protein, partial [Arthrospira platensis SPKY2]